MDTTLDLSDEIAEYVEELEDARAAKKRAAEREQTAREVIVAALKNAGASKGLTASGSGVHLQIQVRKNVSGKKLEAMFPEVYEQVVSESEIEVLKLV